MFDGFSIIGLLDLDDGLGVFSGLKLVGCLILGEIKFLLDFRLAVVRFNRAASATGGFHPGQIPAELPRRASGKTPDRFSAKHSVLILLRATE